MLIRSPDSLNVYRPAALVGHVDENENLTEGEWQKDITGILSTHCKHPEVDTMQKSLQKQSEMKIKIILSPRVF